jgi:SsrA-binding protein
MQAFGTCSQGAESNSMEKQNKKSQHQELVFNRKATFQYEILDTLEVGIVLLGTEIKSLRAHGGGLQDAFISVEHGELWLMNSTIAPYKFASHFNHEERRKRKLLAHKKEIERLSAQIQEKGLTCIPLSLFLKNGLAKVKIAICKGKKGEDKRATIKEREDKRQMQRMLKQHS